MSMTSPFSEITQDAGARAAAARAAATEGTVTRDRTIVEPVTVVRDAWGRLPGDPFYGIAPAGGGGGGGGGPTVLPVSGAAADELRATLRRYGLENLFDTLNRAIIADPTIARTTDALFGAVRNTDIYKQRFKGNADRVARGLSELSEAEYVNQEEQYKTVLRNQGLRRGFYDSQDDFAKFIANDISPNELSDRIQQGYNAVVNAPPAVVNELKRLTGIDDSQLVEYFLDPAKTTTEIERKARSAQIAAQARTTANIVLTAQQAENLALSGVTQAAAQQGFSQIGEQAELFRTNIGEQEITQEEILAGVFTNEQAAARRIAERRRRRQAGFEQGGGFAGASGQQTGLTTVGQ
jgi:hypothetical protein